MIDNNWVDVTCYGSVYEQQLCSITGQERYRRRNLTIKEDIFEPVFKPEYPWIYGKPK